MEQIIKSKIEVFLSNPRSVIFVAVVLFLPLLFLGTRSSHDWGDDFAQYIHQAGNLLSGIPQSETGFIYSQLNYIGPQAYPVGFPLLLVPVYAIAGNSMTAFITMISVMYIVLGVLMVIFFRQSYSGITALVLSVIFIYNPQMIIFKREVMSDIPFTVLLVLNFILYFKLKPGNLKQILVLSVTIGLMLAVRPAGIVFVAAIAIDQCLKFFRKEVSAKELAVSGGILTLAPVFLYFVINSWLFRIPSGGSIRDYLMFYYSGNFIQIIPQNLAHHIEVFRYLYVPEAGILKGFSLLFGSLMLVMTMFGFIKKLLSKPGATEWFFILYVLMLLVFPNNDSAFRLMVPLGFIFLYYAATGIKSIKLLEDISPFTKAISAGILIVLLYTPGLISIARSGSNILEGPQQKSSVEAFENIRSMVPPGSVVAFAKPRALALYSGCRSMADPFTTDPTLIHSQIMQAGASYLLIHKHLTSEPMKRYSRVMQSRLSRVWGNADFTLFRINPVNP